MELQLFNYNGNNVSFRKESANVFINATEMAKPFGKRPIDYLQNQQTQEFINELSKVRKSTLADLVQVTKGGNNAGTWMHEDVAIEFARWLNPAFAIWCNDRIKELMKLGFTATPETLENIVNNPDLVIHLATALKEVRLENEKAKEELSNKSNQLELANRTIDEQAPLVQLAEDCYSSTRTMTASILATRLGFPSANALNRKLHELHIQYKVDGCWKLYSKYEGFGYTKTIPVPYRMKDGSNGTNNQMEWFEKGFVFLRELLNNKESA